MRSNLSVWLVFFFVFGCVQPYVGAQGVQLSPREDYESIPTRRDRPDQRQDQPSDSEQTVGSDAEAATSVSLEPDDSKATPVLLDALSGDVRSMAPEIEQTFGGGGNLDIDLPERFDLKEYLPTPGKQAENDCMAWAIAHASYTCQVCQERRRRPTLDSDLFDPSFIYETLKEARREGETRGGLIPTEVIKFVKSGGCASRAAMKQNGLSPATLVEAKTFRAIRNERADNLQDIKTFLYEGYPVILIVRMGNKFRANERSKNPYRWTDDTPRGENNLHAIVAVGYDEAYGDAGDQDAILIMNSWGTEWKDDGFCWVDASNFDTITRESWCTEAHVIGVKRIAPYSVTIKPEPPQRRLRRSHFPRVDRFDRLRYSLGADRNVYKDGEVISTAIGSCDDIACSRDTLFALSREQMAYRFNSDDDSWTHLNVGAMTNKKFTMLAADDSTSPDALIGGNEIDAGDSTSLHALTDGNEIYAYAKTSGRWTKVEFPSTPSGAAAQAVDLRLIDSKIHATLSDGRVYFRDKNENAWKIVESP